MQIPNEIQEAVKTQLSEHKLDQHIVEVDYAYSRCMDGVNESLHNRDILKRAAEIKYDEVFLNIKKYPENYGYNKAPSDAVCKSEANVDGEYKAAYSAYLGALNEHKQWSGLQAILEHKTSALKQLIQLRNANYYGLQDSTEAGDFEYEGRD